MTRGDGAAIKESLDFTLDLADKILLSAKSDPLDAFMKAVGTLAQVIHILTPDERREQTLDSMVGLLRSYLGMLDTVRGPSSPAFPKG